MKKFRIIALFLLVFLSIAFVCNSQEDDAILKAAHLDRTEEVPILYLKGTPFEIGYQEGKLLKDKIEKLFSRLYKFARRQIKIPFFWKFFLNYRLDRIYRGMEPFIPEEYKEELRGLADGSGISLREMQRLHTLSEIYPGLCSSFIAYGKATADGRLYHMRNFDWAVGLGIQDYPVIKIYRSEDKIPFISIGYAGFSGVLSGMNREGISIAQIGAETVDVSRKGIPMPFLLRKVLEETTDLDEAIDIVKVAERTQGHNFVFASHREGKAVILETTANLFQIFYPNDPREKEIEYAFPIENVILRADTAMDRDIRDKQICTKGNPDKEGIELPYGSSAYEKRYKPMAELIKKYYGKIDSSIAIKIAKAVAPPSNLQSIIYSFPALWVALAKENLPAAKCEYRYYNLIELLEIKPIDEDMIFRAQR